MSVTRTGTHPVVRAAERTSSSSLLGTIVVLFKLRIVLLLVFASVGGALLGAHGRPAFGDLMLLLLNDAALRTFLQHGVDILFRHI